VYAADIDRTLTVHATNRSVTDVLREVRKQSGYDFFYDADLFKGIAPISLALQNVDIREALDRCLLNTGLVYTINNKIITISKGATKSMNTAANRRARVQQSGTISGTITSSNGTTLSGATVRVVELNRSTMTNADGRFTLEVPTGQYTVEVSYVAHDRYQQSGVQVQPEATRTLNINLVETIGAMEEVVVTALGIKREEKEIGYAQQTIHAEELSTAVANTWSDGLKGKVAGLNMTSGNTGPINSQNIQLRGNTSLDPGGNAALIVVDGVPMNQETTAYGNNVGAAYGTEAPVDYGNAISELKQEDIESVSVL